MSGIVNKVKDALSSEKHDNTTTTTTHGTHGTHNTHGTHGTTGTTGTSTNYGPHDSNLANKADPRIDSDLDNRGIYGGLSGGQGGYGTTTGTHGATTGTHGSTNYGPHDSNLANKADPRVDSDLDGHHHTTGGGYGTTTTATQGTHGSTNQGPHNSNLANKLDPRVDSDMDNRGTTGGNYGTTTTGGGYGTTTSTHGTTGTHGGISHSTNAGPHDSNMMNKADPRVDSDLDGRGTHGQHGTTQHGLAGSGTHATPGSGRAQNTAGPHNSDMLNKLDPRVDSDMSGGKTYVGNQTHSRSGSGDSTGSKGKDPTDAAQVPPSVLAHHTGERAIAHDGHQTDHQTRHGSKTDDLLREYGPGHE